MVARIRYLVLALVVVAILVSGIAYAYPWSLVSKYYTMQPTNPSISSSNTQGYLIQLPQCYISSNPYGGYTGTYGLLNCVAINYGAISVVVWFYEPSGGQGAILAYMNAQYPNVGVRTINLYITSNGVLYAGDAYGYTPWQITTSISPGWHIVVFEEWASSTSGPYYLAVYLDGNLLGTLSTTNLPRMFGGVSNWPYNNIGLSYGDGIWPYAPNQWWFFNGAIALVALYNRVLTTGDVLAIYQGNLVTSGLVAVWYGDDYNPSNGHWVSRIGGYTGVPTTSSYPPRGCVLWNSTWYSGPTDIWSNWQQC